ncbi:hypothetical protein LTR37_000704 [Vermiconidia calcicola]|uniref:Uncharacterized protein n=1 Tax=Vermiconidia calcicola TaxID=1690605 RepID=A0ACC3NYD9_9PEZI|nr:hypothetical protein LTR37_000704 [Vermiconidia calcicola]
MAHYNYESLETAEHIRLIDVKDSRYDRRNPSLSSEPHLTIVSFTLDCCPPFETVSYAWGSKIRDRKVLINGSDAVDVTPALEEAMPHLAKLTRTTYLWIDQVCIDQDDVAERSVQVAMMGRIYRRAERLLVWMGPETPDSSKVLELYCILKPVNLAEFETRWVVADRERIEAYCDYAIPCLTRYRAALDAVLMLSWFKRAWIVQEALLARQFTFVWGSRTLEGRALWRLCETLRINYPDTLWSKAACKESVHSPGLFCSFLYIMLARDAEGGQIVRGRSLVAFLHSLRLGWLVPKYYQASDPRDVIFSAYGCHTMPPSLQPNYQLSAEQVFERAARAYIGQTASLAIMNLTNGVFNPPCYTDGLDMLKLPSWVPDWRTPSIWKPIYTDIIVNHVHEEYFCAGKKYPLPNIDVQTDGQLLLRGKVLSHLAYKSEYRIEGRGPKRLDGFGIAALKAEISSVSLISGNLTNRRVFQTVIMDNPQNYAHQTPRPNKGEGLVAWNMYRDVSAWHDEWSFECNQDTSEDPDESTSLQIPHGRWMNNFAPEPDRELLGKATDMTRSAAVNSAGRNPAITNAGTLAMVPFTSQIGDVVAIFHGAHVPTVLRRHTENRYRVVGEAYVEGLYFEDAITWAEDEADDIILI